MGLICLFVVIIDSIQYCVFLALFLFGVIYSISNKEVGRNCYWWRCNILYHLTNERAKPEQHKVEFVSKVQNKKTGD